MIRSAWTPTPLAVRDELARFRHGRLISLMPMLNATFVVFALVSMIGIAPHAPALVRFGMPVAFAATCLWRVTVWLRRRRQDVDAVRARRIVDATIVTTLTMCAFCSCWAILGWMSADPADRAHIALFTATGTLAVSFCLGSIRLAAVACLLIGLAPVGLLLLASGEGANLVAGLGIGVAGTFLGRMVMQQHHQLVALLSLQQDMRTLASTDALTALPNRRALLDVGVASLHGRFGVLLADLDGFKAVNDAHGHPVGDTVLRATAARLRDQTRDTGAIACRLGGDEFALIIPDVDTASMHRLVARLRPALAAPVDHQGRVVRVGASIGWAISSEDAPDIDAVIALADAALYADKARDRRAGSSGSLQPVRKALVIG